MKVRKTVVKKKGTPPKKKVVVTKKKKVGQHAYTQRASIAKKGNMSMVKAGRLQKQKKK